MVAVNKGMDSMCSIASNQMGPYSSSYWCMLSEEFGSVKLYGRASRVCSPPVNTTYVQIEIYPTSMCGGEIIEMEILPLDVCLPTMTGSFKMTLDHQSMSGNLKYTTFSDKFCSIQGYMTTIFAAEASVGTAPRPVPICSAPLPGSSGSSNGLRFYIVSTPASPPPGAVIEVIHPAEELSSTCASFEGDPIMMRYVRPGVCLATATPGQYEKMTCGADRSTCV